MPQLDSRPIRPARGFVLALRSLAVALLIAALGTSGCGSSSDNGTGGGTTSAITVTAVSPSSGPLVGGTSVTVTGTGFTGTVSATFGGAAASVTVNSATSLTVVTPAVTTAGTVDVVVTSSSTGAATFARGFTYVAPGTTLTPPSLNTVSPAAGPLAGGQTVTLSGSDFASDTTVKFGGASATNVTLSGSGSITCVTPAGTASGAVDVVVTSATNGSATLSGGYTYQGQLTVTTITPTSGSVSGSTNVTITGTFFGTAGGANPTVSFGGVSATNVQVTNGFTQISCTTPAHAAGLVSVVVTSPTNGNATAGTQFQYADLAATPRQSSSIAIAEVTSQLYVCNPESNTVSVFDATVATTPTKLGDIAVGNEPRSVAVLASGNKAYVANAKSGTVSVLLPTGRVSSTITVGVEPRAVLLSPNGTRCYVANAISNSISIIDTSIDAVISTVDLTSFTVPGGASGGNGGAGQPRALAMTNNGDFLDTDESLYVALFFAERRPNKTALDEGQDDQRRGLVIKMAADGTNPVSIGLDPLSPNAFGLGLGGPDGTGFNSNGSTLASVGTTNGLGGTVGNTPTNPAVLNFPTGCYPNQLASMSIQPGGQNALYIVSTGASPNGPVRFDSNVQGLVSTVSTTSSSELRVASDTTGKGSAPLNMNRGLGAAAINGNNPATKLFYSVPTAITWRPGGAEAWVAIQSADVVVKMTVDANGTPTVVNAGGATGVTHVDLQLAGVPGNAPFGICFNATGTRMYVNNFVSKSVTVVDPAAATVLGSAQAGAPAPPGDIVTRGAQLFFSGRGPTRPGVATGVLSNNGWGACIECHPDGRTDNVTWMFDAGPRQTIPLDGMFSKRTLNDQRLLNWSAVRDEDQDFELNTRGVSGGRGLIFDDRQIIVVGGVDGTNTANGAYSSFLSPPATKALPQATVGTQNNIANQALPALATARYNAGVATDRTGTLYITEGQSDSVTFLSNIEEFVPGTNSTKVVGAFKTLDSKHKHGAAAVNTSEGVRVYVFGGYDSTGNVTSTVFEFNPTNNTTRAMTSMPFGVAEFGVAVVPATNTNHPQDTIHVVCGNTAQTEGSTNVTNTVLVFTPDPVGLGTWANKTLTAPLSAVRQCMAADVFQPGRGGGALNSVYIFGGRDVTDNITTTVQEYRVDVTQNPSLLTNVGALTPMPAPLASAGVGVGAGAGVTNVYLVGGTEGITGNVTTSIFQFTPNVNPIVGTAGAANFPAGGWESGNGVPEAVLELTTAVSGSAVSIPPPVQNFTPVGNSFRDPDQDAITQWIAAKVRSHVAPLSGATLANTPTAVAAIASGRTAFGDTSGTIAGVAGISCATCHGGPKWSRSKVDYLSPPSATLTFGAQQIQGVELRFTQTQPQGFPASGLTNAAGAVQGVLLDVGTFVPDGAGFGPGATGRINEVRVNPNDSGSRIQPLGANGFNSPSLLSVAGTAPYYYSGLEQTLDQVFNGTVDQLGSSTLKSVHFISDPTQRFDMELFMQTIDESTQPFP